MKPAKIDHISKLINDKTKILFLVGAGISTSCGIPDFRSPKTGLYHNLSRLNLPYAEAVFDIDYYRKSPKAFYTLCEDMMRDDFEPSKFHYLMKLVEKRNQLVRVYTQNIDTLERKAEIDEKYIIEAHGSFHYVSCIDCGERVSRDDFKDYVRRKDIMHCSKCEGLVKPEIVFFGEGLPEEFFSTWEDEDDYDLCIVAGTSLTVHPFASLPSEVDCPRILINLEKAGDFGSRKTDLWYKGKTDEFVDELVKKLGWEKEFEELLKNKEELCEAQESVNDTTNTTLEDDNEALEVTEKLEQLNI